MSPEPGGDGFSSGVTDLDLDAKLPLLDLAVNLESGYCATAIEKQEAGLVVQAHATGFPPKNMLLSSI